MRVGFIGLGNMGSGMARNLIKAGHQLTVYNRTRQRAEGLESLGARVVSSPAEAASAAEVLITMLADDGAVKDALLGHDGALGTLPPGAVHVGMNDQPAAFAAIGGGTSGEAAALHRSPGLRTA